MRWRQPAHRALADAIVASFHIPADQARGELARFTPAQWRKTWYWLDASGLSLYFLRHAEDTDLISSLDSSTVERLRGKLVSNRERTAALFIEFAAINRAFLRKRIVYANLKGFTLTPDSCPAPEMRLQLDFDFLVGPEYLPACRSILEQRGYELHAATSSTWEFKAGHRPTTRHSDPYKVNAYRSVELHFNLDGMNRTVPHDERLDRISVWHHNGHSFPALSPHDQLIGQALHIFSHLRSASTRPAWLLEFKQHLLVHGDDICFWREVRSLARANAIAPMALGAAIRITRNLFGGIEPSFTRDWAERSVPAGVAAWLDAFGQQAVMADFPGTKLYLLLERELPPSAAESQHAHPKRMIPSIRIPRLFRPHANESSQVRFLRWYMQLRFVLFRLRFHFVEGIRFVLAAAIWNRRRTAPLGSSFPGARTVAPR